MLTIVASRTTINCAVPSSASTAHRLVSTARPASEVTGLVITQPAAAPRTLLLEQAASGRPPPSPRRSTPDRQRLLRPRSTRSARPSPYAILEPRPTGPALPSTLREFEKRRISSRRRWTREGGRPGLQGGSVLGRSGRYEWRRRFGTDNRRPRAGRLVGPDAGGERSASPDCLDAHPCSGLGAIRGHNGWTTCAVRGRVALAFDQPGRHPPVQRRGGAVRVDGGGCRAPRRGGS